MTWQVIHGDCLDVLRTMDAGSVDSIVCDPPYGLSFMGKKWDYDVPSVDVWAECLRALKPGGHLLSFAGTRTQHRMAVRIEDAGFEIRDMIAWVYGSGFPKSLNIGDGRGTALKPALEPITLARKPLIGTVAANVLAHGTGGLNVDGCRVAGEDTTTRHNSSSSSYMTGRIGEVQPKQDEYVTGSDKGRWPANLIHDGSPEVLAGFPVTGPSNGSKTFGSGRGDGNSKQNCYGDMYRTEAWSGVEDNGGSAARFFYCAKADKADRDDGMHGAARRNHHPTVKPTDLMRYLCRLITPPGGIVLDPFTGSGSTGRGAVIEGFSFIGIEREADYCEIARKRIAAAAAQGNLFHEVVG